VLFKTALYISGYAGIEMTLFALNNIHKPISSFHDIILTLMEKITIPFSELSFSYARSGGAGGQNVNKVNSKVMMSWDIYQSSCLNDAMKERFIQRYKGQISDQGLVQIVSQRSRSQKENMDDCIHKLHEMIESIRVPPRTRKATRPTRSSIHKRLNSKKKDSEKKRLRKKDF
jgi:ribosome-associated protein